MWTLAKYVVKIVRNAVERVLGAKLLRATLKPLRPDDRELTIQAMRESNLYVSGYVNTIDEMIAMKL